MRVNRSSPDKRTDGITFTVLGQLCSMKNSRRLLKNKRTGKTFSAKSTAAERYCSDFLLQVPVAAKRGLGSQSEPLRAIVTVWYASWRSDLDCGLIYDLLQEAGVVANDRFIREKHEYAEVHPGDERVEITIEFI